MSEIILRLYEQQIVNGIISDNLSRIDKEQMAFVSLTLDWVMHIHMGYIVIKKSASTHCAQAGKDICIIYYFIYLLCYD